MGEPETVLISLARSTRIIAPVSAGYAVLKSYWGPVLFVVVPGHNVEPPGKSVFPPLQNSKKVIFT